jgi:hypothetical protein
MKASIGGILLPDGDSSNVTMNKSASRLPGDFIIAGEKRVSDWQTFKSTLTVGGDIASWEKAYTDYFYARLWHRYIKPIEILQSSGSTAGEGFSIVVIQCSLIEFLESTIQGISYVYSRNGNPPVGRYEYSNSGAIFESFLTNRPPFNREFGPQESHDFYVSVRCGVLHEARTKNGWTILAKNKSGQIIDANLKVVYRDNFQSALEDFSQWYKQELSVNRDFQAALIRKFDGLCQ